MSSTPNDHPLLGTYCSADELGSDVLITVALDDAGALQISAFDTHDGELLEATVLRHSPRSVTFDLRTPSTGYRVRDHLWLDDNDRPVMTLRYDEPWKKVEGPAAGPDPSAGY